MGRKHQANRMKERENSIRVTGVASVALNLSVAPARMKHWRFAEKSFWISTQARLQRTRRKRI